MKDNILYRIHEDSDPLLLLNFKGKACNLVVSDKKRLNNDPVVTTIGNELPCAWIHVAVFKATNDLLETINSIITYLINNPLYDHAYLMYKGELIRVYKLSPELHEFINIKKYFNIRKIKNVSFWSNV